MRFSDGPIESSEYGGLVIDIYREAKNSFGYVITRDREFVEAQWDITAIQTARLLAQAKAEELEAE